MNDAFLPPPEPVAAPADRSSVVRVSQAVLVGAGLLLVVIAALLAFLPVPPNAYGTCGARFSSASAVSVVRDPDQVLDWQPPRGPSDHVLRNVCVAEAQYRLRTAFVLLAGGPLVAVCALAIEAVWRRGRPAPPPPPAYALP